MYSLRVSSLIQSWHLCIKKGQRWRDGEAISVLNSKTQRWKPLRFCSHLSRCVTHLVFQNVISGPLWELWADGRSESRRHFRRPEQLQTRLSEPSGLAQLGSARNFMSTSKCLHSTNQAWAENVSSYEHEHEHERTIPSMGSLEPIVGSHEPIVKLVPVESVRRVGPSRRSVTSVSQSVSRVGPSCRSVGHSCRSVSLSAIPPIATMA